MKSEYIHYARMNRFNFSIKGETYEKWNKFEYEWKSLIIKEWESISNEDWKSHLEFRELKLWLGPPGFLDQ